MTVPSDTAESNKLKDVLEASIEDTLCPENALCNARVTELPGTPSSSGGTPVQFELVIEAPCATSDCSDSGTAASSLYDQVSNELQRSISDESLMNAVTTEAGSENVDSLAGVDIQSGKVGQALALVGSSAVCATYIVNSIHVFIYLPTCHLCIRIIMFKQQFQEEFLFLTLLFQAASKMS